MVSARNIVIARIIVIVRIVIARFDCTRICHAFEKQISKSALLDVGIMFKGKWKIFIKLSVLKTTFEIKAGIHPRYDLLTI